MITNFALQTIAFAGAFALLYLVYRGTDRRTAKSIKAGLFGISVLYGLKLVWFFVRLIFG